LHPDLTCLDLAERRRVFPKAFRTAVREYLEAEPRGTSDGGLEVAAKPEAGRTS
jgi:hypothetical protein